MKPEKLRGFPYVQTRSTYFRMEEEPDEDENNNNNSSHGRARQFPPAVIPAVVKKSSDMNNSGGIIQQAAPNQPMNLLIIPAKSMSPWSGASSGAENKPSSKTVSVIIPHELPHHGGSHNNGRGILIRRGVGPNNAVDYTFSNDGGGFIKFALSVFARVLLILSFVFLVYFLWKVMRAVHEEHNSEIQ